MVVLASPLILELILGSVLAVHFLRGGISSVLALLASIANTRANTPTSEALAASAAHSAREQDAAEEHSEQDEQTTGAACSVEERGFQ